VGRLWIAALGEEEALYEVDLPGCCQRSARGSEVSFECPACGAAWQAPLPVELEECAFTERTSDGERKGAA
jgi:hypothetical protein